MSRHRSIEECHIDQLLEALDDLLAVPELLYFEELFDKTHDAILRANVVRAAVRDELGEMADL